jgi:hypothetical protein
MESYLISSDRSLAHCVPGDTPILAFNGTSAMGSTGTGGAGGAGC